MVQDLYSRYDIDTIAQDITDILQIKRAKPFKKIPDVHDCSLLIRMAPILKLVGEIYHTKVIPSAENIEVTDIDIILKQTLQAH